jgi:hypothetical protein
MDMMSLQSGVAASGGVRWMLISIHLKGWNL